MMHWKVAIPILQVSEDPTCERKGRFVPTDQKIDSHQIQSRLDSMDFEQFEGLILLQNKVSVHGG